MQMLLQIKSYAEEFFQINTSEESFITEALTTVNAKQLRIGNSF